MSQDTYGRRKASEVADELINKNLPSLRGASRTAVKKRVIDKLIKVAKKATSIHDRSKTVFKAAEANKESFQDKRISCMFWPEDIDVLLVAMQPYMDERKKAWVGEAAHAVQTRAVYERDKAKVDHDYSENAAGVSLEEMSLHDVVDLLMEENWQLSALYGEDKAILAKDDTASNGVGEQEDSAFERDMAFAPLSRSELLGIYLEEVSPQVLGIKSRPQGDGSGESSGEPPEHTEAEEFPNADARLGSLTSGQVRELMSDLARETFSRWREATASIESAALDKLLSVSDDEIRERAYRLKVESLFSIFFNPLKEQLLRHDMEEEKRLTYQLNDLASVNPQQMAKEYKTDEEGKKAMTALDEETTSLAHRLDLVEKHLSTPSRYIGPKPIAELPPSMETVVREVAHDELKKELKRMLNAQKS